MDRRRPHSHDEEADQLLADGDEARHAFMRAGVRRRRSLARRCATAIAGALLSVAVAVASAVGFFSAQGTGTARGTVGVLSAPSVSSATPGAATVALRWSAVQAPAGSTAVTYYVLRDGEGPAGDCPSPTRPTRATGCTDSPPSGATHRYAVVAVWRSWTSTSADPTVVEVVKQPQAITFTSMPPSAASVGGASYAVRSTGYAVTFTIDPASASVCSIAASTVSFTAAGTCTINADQARDASNDAARQAQQTFAVGPATSLKAIPSSPSEKVLRAAFNAWQLMCANRRLALVDVTPSGGDVILEGAADRTLSGRRVRIVVTATGRTVARPTVDVDGSFQAKLPAPPRAISATSASRYQAVLGTDRSPPLRLARRIIVQSARAADAKLTITGRVTPPPTHPVHGIVLERRLGCGRHRVVTRVPPRSDGSFRVTIPAPADQPAAIYRLRTRLRMTPESPKTFTAFTLPVAVAL